MYWKVGSGSSKECGKFGGGMSRWGRRKNKKRNGGGLIREDSVLESLFWYKWREEENQGKGDRLRKR